MKKLLAACFAITGLLGGCAAIDFQLTKFEPTSSNSTYAYYKYTSFADAVYPEDSADAEKIRIKWLEEWLSKNGMASKKYKIVDRSPMKQTNGLFGGIYQIYYQVQVEK